MGRKICYTAHEANHLNPAKQELTKKEKPDAMDDWENCKGQCGFTQFCRQCMLERDWLIRERKKAEWHSLQSFFQYPPRNQLE